MLQPSPRLPVGDGGKCIGVLHTENYDNPKRTQSSGPHKAAAIGTRTSVNTPVYSHVHIPAYALV